MRRFCLHRPSDLLNGLFMTLSRNGPDGNGKGQSCYVHSRSDSHSTRVLTTLRSLTHTFKECALSWQDLRGNQTEIRRCEKQTG